MLQEKAAGKIKLQEKAAGKSCKNCKFKLSVTCIGNQVSMIGKMHLKASINGRKPALESIFQ
jgi:hypothetical protein